ncbi:MerR family transcriptional regulator [bacterium]|nr:MerR family transcriptional regulator [bacterium]
MTPKSPKQKLLSIGKVARETGLSIDTLRMWERRYGAPQSIRLPSGHRRYAADEVERLQIAARALQAGYRASQVAAMPLDQLRAMLRAGRRKSELPTYITESGSELDRQDLAVIEDWIDAAVRFDELTLTSGFLESWGRLGPMRFLQERAAPFLKRVGDSWASGELSIADEHFAGERLGDFLSSIWRRRNEQTIGPKVVLATLPDELHHLGLQMAATVVTLADCRAIYVGASSPPDEIARAVRQSGAPIVAISASATMPKAQVREHLTALRRELHPEVELVCGGESAPDPGEVPGITVITVLQDFQDWLKARSASVPA